MSDDRTFWNTVKPFLLDKTKKQGKITLVEKDETATDDKRPCKMFNEFYVNAFPNVNKPEFSYNFDHSVTDVTIAKYENHRSVIKIGNKQASSVTFWFKFVIEKEIEKILWNLSEKRACRKSEILLTIIKENIDVFTKFLNYSFNEVLNFSQFPSSMKLEDVFKKEDVNLQSNYAPIGMFPKLFEKIIHDEISIFFFDFLSKHECGFRKGFGA